MSPAWPALIQGLLLASGAAAPPARTAPAGETLGVVAVDFASLASLTRETMCRELGLVLKPAGLELAWRRAGPEDDTDPSELRVVFLASTGLGADQGKRALASTATNAPVPTVWVYVPNVALAIGWAPDAVASSIEAQRQVGVALGRVLAHELVHALAPELEHSKAGLLRASLHAFRLTRGRPALDAGCAEALANGARAWRARRGTPMPAEALLAR